jgi:hypothetical protein
MHGKSVRALVPNSLSTQRREMIPKPEGRSREDEPPYKAVTDVLQNTTPPPIPAKG